MKNQLRTALLMASWTVAAADPVLQWNAAALDAIRASKTAPPAAARALAILHVAIYDAVNSIKPSHHSYLDVGRPIEDADPAAAVSGAAFQVLSVLFPDKNVGITNLNVRYTDELRRIPDGPAKEAGISWGWIVGKKFLDLRANDGATSAGNYTPSLLPGRWRPTPPAHAAPLLPQWPTVRPFAILSVADFRPPAPPDITSSSYSFEFNTVKMYGAANSTVRTADQTQVAYFWANGAGTATPPGHWNEIAAGIALERGQTMAANARMLALLNCALADAAIAAWDAKYAYDFWRPITAIREANNDGNPETEGDPNWTPLLVTPPFPEFTSGHSSFSAAAAALLADFFGTDKISFSVRSDGLPGVVRQYQSLAVAADESGVSRLYGGIHWPCGNLHAINAGHRLGHHVFSYLLRPLASQQFSRIHSNGAAAELVYSGEGNHSYVIKSSSDLHTWETLATVASADGIVRFRDVNAPQAQLRFYRVEGP